MVWPRCLWEREFGCGGERRGHGPYDGIVGSSIECGGLGESAVRSRGGGAEVLVSDVEGLVAGAEELISVVEELDDVIGPEQLVDVVEVPSEARRHGADLARAQLRRGVTHEQELLHECAARVKDWHLERRQVVEVRRVEDS